MPKIKNNNYICYAPCLSNSIVYDHDFCYTCVKWWFLQVFFYFFEIFIFQAVKVGRGVKRAKSSPKWKITMISVMWWYFQVFLSLFWNLIFWAVRGWPNMTKKKICLLQLMSQKPYIIWLSFMVHLCKMVSLGFFFNFFKILILSHELLYDFYLWFLFMCKM